MRLLIPAWVAVVLTGVGLYAMIARRHIIMVLIGAELMVAGAGLLLIVASARWADVAGHVATVVLVTLAAAASVLAVAVVVLLHQVRHDTAVESAVAADHRDGKPPELPDAVTDLLQEES